MLLNLAVMAIIQLMDDLEFLFCMIGSNDELREK